MQGFRLYLVLCVAASPCVAATVFEAKCAALLQITDVQQAIAELERAHDQVLDRLREAPVEVSGVEPILSRVQLRGSSRFVVVDSAELAHMAQAPLQEIHLYDRELWRAVATPKPRAPAIRTLGPVTLTREQAAGLLEVVVANAVIGSAAATMKRDGQTYLRRTQYAVLGLVPSLTGAALLVAQYLGNWSVLPGTLAQVAAGAAFVGGVGHAAWQLETAKKELDREAAATRLRAEHTQHAALRAKSAPLLSEADARHLSVATTSAVSHLVRDYGQPARRWVHVAYGDREGLRGRRTAWVDLFLRQDGERVAATAFVRP